MSNDYDYVQVEAIVKEVVSRYRGSPTAIAKLYAFEHLLAQGRYAEILSLKNAIEEWKAIAKKLADEVVEDKAKIYLTWGRIDEVPCYAWNEYVRLRDKESKE